jgi:hypothetical protein
MIRVIATPPLEEPRIIIREVTDPAEIARARASYERAKRNSDWLQAHWGDLMPQVLGKYVAVAGQQGFIAGTDQEARALARAAHPDDDGMFSMFVFPNNVIRIYANHR